MPDADPTQSSASLKRVGLFATCLVDLARPQVGFAALRLLEDAGFEVHVPAAQTCCGQPGYNSGDRTSARALAVKVLEEFEAFDFTVIPSGSCTGMMRVHYHDLFAEDPSLHSRMGRWLQKTFELTEFLSRYAPQSGARSAFAGSVTYHDSCSGLRELGVSQQPRQLLANVPGASLSEMKDCRTCCGFGGTFSVKYDAISAAIADDKLKNVQDSGAQAVVMGDVGCLLHLEGRMRRTNTADVRFMHVAEVLAYKE